MQIGSQQNLCIYILHSDSFIRKTLKYYNQGIKWFLSVVNIQKTYHRFFNCSLLCQDEISFPVYGTTCISQVLL